MLESDVSPNSHLGITPQVPDRPDDDNDRRLPRQAFARLAASGRFHVSPGRPLDVRRGSSRDPNDYCCDKLAKLGQITPDEKAAIGRAITEEILERLGVP